MNQVMGVMGNLAVQLTSSQSAIKDRFMLFQNIDDIIFVSGYMFNFFSSTSGVIRLVTTDEL